MRYSRGECCPFFSGVKCMLFCTADIPKSAIYRGTSREGLFLMARNTVRALCAQIAVELDPKKVDRLIEELTLILLADYLQAQTEFPRDSGRALKIPNRSS